jgi:pyruvate dehydrogenase E1 component
VLWLATRMIDSANHDRPQSEVKVGGHQASSASMVSIMTALYFAFLEAGDKVAVKPHASPVYHAIKYLTGGLDRSYLTRLRDFGGLQAYPSRTKDPDRPDFSTGSVGLGVVAPLFASFAQRYVHAHFAHSDGRRPRFIAIAGDAELDEGNVWEAVSDPSLQGLGDVMWIIDTNRQSLDRIVPEQKIKKLIEFFHAAGWHVVEAKWGSRLVEAFNQPGGDVLRRHIEEMSNERYQSLFAFAGPDLRDQFLADGDGEVRDVLSGWADDELTSLLHNLGGHDLSVLIDCFQQCDRVTDRPSVVIAYTVKGWGLPIAGDPLNHSALLTSTQIDAMRHSMGLTNADEWDRFDANSAAGRWCATIGERLRQDVAPERPHVRVPNSIGSGPWTKPVSTQEVFGRILARLAADDEVAPRLVTASPDVSVSTNLGGWINKVGVFHPIPQPDVSQGGVLRWNQHAGGQHIELGISEMNLFLMLQALGLSHEVHGEVLLPIGTVYDPFVCRGLDALIYALYSGSRFILAGTPSGITLAPEGGAHQSSVTASLGTELPSISYVEPAYAQALDWLLCDGLQRLTADPPESTYLRISTRPIDQTPFTELTERVDVDTLRADVVNGGYRLRAPVDRPAEIVLVTCGAVVPEVVTAAQMLDDEALPAIVLDLTSPDRVYRGWRNETAAAASSARPSRPTHHLAHLLAPHERRLPMVTVQDAASHHLAWVGSVFGSRVVAVGVDAFGQSGTISDLYSAFGLSSEQIVNAALVACA